MSDRALTIPRGYWRLARAPRYSVSFAFPLLAVYEALAFVLSRLDVAGVRNGADVLLKSLFLSLGGRTGLAVFGAALIGGGAVLVWRDVKKSGRIQPKFFWLMLGESVLYALVFGAVAATLTGLLLPFATAASPAGVGEVLSSFSLPVQLMISLGAGIYEELLFRVLLVSGLALVATRLFGWHGTKVGVFAVVTGALIFAAFHYVGPYGERLALGSFIFRTVAGLLFSGLYLLRGFGITAWTHALYDVFLAL
ncbi:MAG TPA: CPBP family glutamic-type intramembrane protease [Gemmatimonadales bacterium]